LDDGGACAARERSVNGLFSDGGIVELYRGKAKGWSGRGRRDGKIANRCAGLVGRESALRAEKMLVLDAILRVYASEL
jgi:hypothetical protein